MFLKNGFLEGGIMTTEILMTSSNTQLTAIIKKVAAELGEEVRIVEAVMEDAVEKAKEIVKNEDLKIVISRSGTAEGIHKVVNVPVIRADSTPFDILRALLKARKLGSKIGLLQYENKNNIGVVKILEEALSCPIYYLTYRSLNEARIKIRYAADLGIEVIVCGGTRAVQWIAESGMKPVMIANSGQVIRDALQRAREIINFTKRERVQAENLKAIINSSEDGIIGLDPENRITIINPAVEKMFALKRSELIDCQVYDLPPKNPIRQIILGKSNNKELINIRGHLLVAHILPVNVDQEKIGAMLTFRDVTKIQQLEQKIRKELYQKGLIAKFCFDDIIADSNSMKSVIEKAKKFSQIDSTVLINGESGTGKELFAQSIHNASQRRDGPFVAINCAALPQNLLESELFGYEEGAFTGAKKGGKPGLFELAHGGTIFLDEIGKMSLDLQSRLLRVLQEREVMRLGGDKIIPVDIRIIAASNENLWLAVKEKIFRNDFFFRLNVLNLAIPPLRKRKEDIPVLIDFYIKSFNQKFNKNISNIPLEMRHMFTSYNWPGNVRELENIIERYVILAEENKDNQLILNNLLDEVANNDIRDSDFTYDDTRIIVDIDTMEEMEKQILKKLLEKVKNKSDLAMLLDISRATLWKRLRNL